MTEPVYICPCCKRQTVPAEYSNPCGTWRKCVVRGFTTRKPDRQLSVPGTMPHPASEHPDRT